MLQTKITLQKMQFYTPNLGTIFSYIYRAKNNINFVQESKMIKL